MLPPIVDDGILGWLRKNLFSGIGNSITTRSPGSMFSALT